MSIQILLSDSLALCPLASFPAWSRVQRQFCARLGILTSVLKVTHSVGAGLQHPSGVALPENEPAHTKVTHVKKNNFHRLL
jgi:hypothetical protein